MAQQPIKPVMDIVPWSKGEGFQGGESWWEYMLQQHEEDRLNFLLLAATLSSEVCHLLLTHDEHLLTSFELSDKTLALLNAIHADTLPAFVQAMIQGFRWDIQETIPDDFNEINYE